MNLKEKSLKCSSGITVDSMFLFITVCVFTNAYSQSLLSFWDLSSVDYRNKAEILCRDIGCSCDL